MIRLDVQEYCQSCCDFEPDVIRPEKNVFTDVDGNRLVIQTDTIVRCKYAKRCENIRRYLKQQSEENKDSEKSD